MSKVALVTGSRRGIGLGIAEQLAKDGFNIVMNDIVDKSEAEESIKKLEDLGAEVLYCQCDISKAEQRAKMVEDIKAKFGKINVLVNNAGVAPKQRLDITEATEESFDRLISINLKGPYFVTQAIANFMLELRKAGNEEDMSIVNISSVSSQTASIARGDYCISKAGISMSTKLWAVRLAADNIMVYEIQPGVIMTDMTSVVKDKYDKLIFEGDLVPQKRWGYPEDIGKAVKALVSGDFNYSTGQVIMVEGGQLLHRL